MTRCGYVGRERHDAPAARLLTHRRDAGATEHDLVRSGLRGADAGRRLPDLTLLAVGLLTLLALGLRLTGIGDSLFGDELFLYTAVHDHSLHEIYVTVRETEKTPPLGFVLGWLLARGRYADELVRVPSLLASVAAVPLVFALGARTVGRPAALVAAAWLALSPFQIFYGSETRVYAQVTTFVLLSTLALLLALEDGRRRWWVLYAAAAAAAIYSHYIAVMILAPQAVWALGPTANGGASSSWRARRSSSSSCRGSRPSSSRPATVPTRRGGST